MKLDDLPQAPARPHNFFALDSGVRFVEMDAQLIQDSARLAAQLGLRGADSTYVAVAVRLKLSLFTLDIDQRQCAKRVVRSWKSNNTSANPLPYEHGPQAKIFT